MVWNPEQISLYSGLTDLSMSPPFNLTDQKALTSCWYKCAFVTHKTPPSQ